MQDTTKTLSNINKSLEISVIEPMQFICDFFENDDLSTYAPTNIKALRDATHAYCDAVHRAAEYTTVANREAVATTEKALRRELTKMQLWLFEEGDKMEVDPAAWNSFAPGAAMDANHMLKSKIGAMGMALQLIHSSLDDIPPDTHISGGVLYPSQEHSAYVGI